MTEFFVGAGICGTILFGFIAYVMWPWVRWFRKEFKDKQPKDSSK